jgi:hypothetical protein
MMPRTTLVDARGAARTLSPLGIKCDAKEIPKFLNGQKPAGWWLFAHCQFDGQAAGGGETGTLGDAIDTSCEGTAAVAVGDGQLIGILSPNDKAQAALWWAWEVNSLQIQSTGSQGFLKKRPTDITITAADGALKIKDVSRLYRNSGNYQSGQEASLLKALGQ